MIPDTREHNYGCLTPLTRKYLQTRNKEESIDEDEKEKRKQYDFRIKRHAKQSLKDLTLVASAYTEKRNQDIFSIEDLKSLLSAVIYKIGRDTTQDGPYYLILINTIIDTLNRDPDGSLTQLRFQIVEDLYGYHPINPPDATNRYLRRNNLSSKK